MKIEEQFLNELLAAVKEDRLELPTLPEVALRIREVVQNPDVNIGSLAQVIAKDAGLSARIIRIANSPMVRGSAKVENLQTAITRMGINYVKNLATGFAMQQIFQATSDVIDRRLRATWAHSLNVASIAYVIAKNFTRIPADQAMLAGLTHEIGILPILTAAEHKPDLLNDAAAIERIIQKIHPQVGFAILKSWEFPPEIAVVPLLHAQLRRNSPKVDCIDIVTAAALHASRHTTHPLAQADWSSVTSFERLGLDPERSLDDFADDLSAAKDAMG